MMDDLISRKALLDIVGKIPLSWEYGQGVSDVYDIIKAMPTLTLDDLRPKGRWEPNEPEGDVWFHCSECGTEISTSWDYDCDEMWNFCPHCGADMRGCGEDA